MWSAILRVPRSKPAAAVADENHKPPRLAADGEIVGAVSVEIADRDRGGLQFPRDRDFDRISKRGLVHGNARTQCETARQNHLYHDCTSGSTHPAAPVTAAASLVSFDVAECMISVSPGRTIVVCAGGASVV